MVPQGEIMDINKIIIQNVISQICLYIKHISPKNIVYIAFDGVAPVAK
jgi:5'-3' exonuclease